MQHAAVHCSTGASNGSGLLRLFLFAQHSTSQHRYHAYCTARGMPGSHAGNLPAIWALGPTGQSHMFAGVCDLHAACSHLGLCACSQSKCIANLAIMMG
jgi:hypothetical protein